MPWNWIICTFRNWQQSQWQACPPSQTWLKRSWVGFQKVKYYHKSRQLCPVSVWPDMPGTSEYLWVTNRLYRSSNICFKWAATTCRFWGLVGIIQWMTGSFLWIQVLNEVNNLCLPPPAFQNAFLNQGNYDNKDKQPQNSVCSPTPK